MSRPSSPSRLRYAVLLILSTFCVYLNAIPHPFVHDELVFIVQNPAIDKLSFKESNMKKLEPKTTDDSSDSDYEF